MQATMAEDKPHANAALRAEVENAAHILIQAMMTPLPPCSSASSPPKP